MSAVLDLPPIAASAMTAVSATQLVAGIQKVSRTVAAQGAVLITKHDQPTMVLMSVEHYQQLQRAAEPDLGALAGEFDALLGRMQGEAAGQAFEQAFAMSPEAIGQAAQAAARPAKSAKPRRKAA